MYKESQTLELKRAVTDEIKKRNYRIVNAEGDVIIIGVDNDGTLS